MKNLNFYYSPTGTKLRNIVPLILLLFGLPLWAQMPDLVIQDVYWENLNGPDDYIERGDSVVFYFWGENIGNDSTPDGVTLGGQFRVSELEHGWVLHQQAGWAVVKNSYLPAGDSMLFTQNPGSGSGGAWIAGPPGNYKVWTYFDDAGGGECKRICESDETNNFNTEYFTVYPGISPPEKQPDLAVTKLEFTDVSGIPLSPGAGEDVYFRATVVNLGNEVAADPAGISVSFYSNTMDHLIASTSGPELITSLDPGESMEVTGNMSEGFNNGTAQGSWLAATGDSLIICKVDAAESLDEMTELNNIFSRVLYVDVPEVDQKPDLVITDIQFDPGMVSLNDTVSLSAIVVNTGTVGVPAGSSINAIWTNEEGDPISVTVGDNLINDSIAPGDSVTVTGNFEGEAGRWVPPSQGLYVFGVIIDQSGALDEGAETNNSFAKALVVHPLPDPAVTSVSYGGAPDTIVALSDVVFTATVENLFGLDVPAGSSLIMNWNVSGLGDVGSDTVVLDAPLAPGTQVDFTMEGSWLAFSGDRMIKASLSWDGDESFSDNNAAMDSLFIKKFPGKLPDLVPTEIKWSPENPREGDTISLWVVVKNTGDTATMEGFGIKSHFHINGTQVGWVHDTSLYIPALGAGEEIELPFDRVFAGRYFTAPRFGEGDHVVKATIDRDKRIEESDDDNNVLEVIVSIGPPRLPDLQVTGMSWSPEEPAEGEMITLSAYLKNEGEKELSDTIVVLWKNDGEVIDSLLYTEGLAVGDSVQVSGNNQWQAAGGMQTIQVLVNAHWMVEESDTTNNMMMGEFRVIGTGIKDDMSSGFAVYPNPASSRVLVEYTASREERIVVSMSNILGQKVIEKLEHALPGKNSIILDVDECKNGIYFLRVGSFCSRVVVSK